MGMMEKASIVPPTAPEPSDADQTLMVNKGRSKRTVIITVACVVLGAAAAIFVAYRLFGGNGGAVATDLSHVETKPDKAAVSPPDAPVSVCQGDLSQASEQRQWYCNGFMPWKQAVDARLTERADTGTPTSVWILIGLLVANGVVTWIMLLRRRRPPA